MQTPLLKKKCSTAGISVEDNSTAPLQGPVWKIEGLLECNYLNCRLKKSLDCMFLNAR